MNDLPDSYDDWLLMSDADYYEDYYDDEDDDDPDPDFTDYDSGYVRGSLV